MTAATLESGDVVADTWTVERSLGAGGIGVVYLARDVRLDRPVAIKLLHAEFAASEDAEARFKREARALSRVLHPNVVGIHAFGRHRDAWYLVMEYVEGKSLDQIVRDGPLDLGLALELTRQVAAGLAEAHALGIVHRDVKPANVLVRTLASGGLLAKVADFGLARTFQGDVSVALTGAATILGTPAYMSPEQIQGHRVDGRSDLYALAVMFWQMLTGQLPFQRDTIQGMLIAHLLHEPPPLPPDLARGVPALVERELRRALSKDPADRHPDATTFAQCLDVAAGRHTARPAADAVACPGCAGPAPAGGFCSNCGGAVPMRACVACGVERVGERYACDACGASLLSWPATAAAFVGAVRQSAAAVLVARLPYADVEAFAEAAAAFATIVAREGGRTLAICGGEALAAFGLGGFRDGDVERAVNAGLAIVGAAPGATGTARDGVRAAVEVGTVQSHGTAVSWGLALCGGEAVEDARKVVSLASAGQVVVGAKAYREVRGVFEVRADANRKAHRVLRRRDASLALSDYLSRDVARPLVARGAELTLALKAARRARRDGAFMAVALAGTAEVGKSRLVGEVLRTLEESGESWRFELVRCSPVDLPAGWQPFAGLVRDAVVTDSDHAQVRLSRLPGMQDGDPERAMRRVQALVRMLGLERPSTPDATPRPASESEVTAALEAWAAVVRGLCSLQPVALVVEDLHYARPVMLQLLARIAAACDDVPLCLVLPLRSDRADAVLEALRLAPQRMVSVAVEPFDPDDTEVLVRELLDGLEPPAGLATQVHRFSDGLPGRVAQAIDTLIDEGALLLTEDGWLLEPSHDVTALLRRSLQDLLMRRVGRLSPSDRALLEAVATAGGSAPHGMLSALLQREVGPADTDRVRQLGLLGESRTQPFVGHREWQLRPEALTPLLLHAMPRSARAALHQHAATWLKLWSGPQPPALAARLAHHHLEAGDVDVAVRQLLRNAVDAVHAFANRDGFEAYALAAAVAQGWLDAGGSATEDACWHRVRALVGHAETGLVVGEVAAALQSADAAIALALQRPELGSERVRARRIRGQVLDSLGQPEDALAALRAAVDDARSFDDGFDASVYAVSLIAMVLLRTGRQAEAEATARRALDECAEEPLAGHPDLAAGVGRLHTWLGHAAARKGEQAEATLHYQAGADAFAHAGDDVAAAMTELSLGNLAWRVGQLDHAEVVFRRVARRCVALDAAIGVANAQTNLGQVLVDLGRPREALDVLAESEQTLRRMGRMDFLAETLRLMALAHRALGQTEQARTVARQALETAERTGQAAEAKAAHHTLKGMVPPQGRDSSR
ncbi:MAG: tetratricopeptide repeat protein [Myxococcales bacterium]|nr:tetratricopeptide repeat protein [Myxococcales bacterium]